MDVGPSFCRNDDGEIESFELIRPSPVDVWGTCDPETTRPDGLRGWLRAFGHMLGATRKTDEARNHREARGQLGQRPCPLESMLTWSSVCGRFTEDHRRKLRTVRLPLPTAPELTGTIALSYCEQALQQVHQRSNRLMRVVKHDAKSFELSGQERMAFHADQIVCQFDEAVDGTRTSDRLPRAHRD